MSEGRKKNLDLGQLWPGGGELSQKNRAVSWLHLSRRQHACCHQACTILGRLLCASPPGCLYYFLHFICSAWMHFKLSCSVEQNVHFEGFFFCLFLGFFLVFFLPNYHFVYYISNLLFCLLFALKNGTIWQRLHLSPDCR